MRAKKDKFLAKVSARNERRIKIEMEQALRAKQKEMWNKRRTNETNH